MHHRLHHFFGRHHGGRGFGHFGKGFMDGGDMGGRAFGMGRKLASVDLQLLILGCWRKSPAMATKSSRPSTNGPRVFTFRVLAWSTPRLPTSRKSVTPPSRPTAPASSTKSPTRARSIWRAIVARGRPVRQFGRVGERMDRVRRAMQAEQTGGESGADDERRGSKELMRARHDLKAALAGKWDGSREEQQRIVDILKRATQEILRQ